MKIIVYGAHDDEIPYMTQWQATTGHTLEIHQELLDDTTIDWAAGFDGINVLQTTPYSQTMFAKMAALGIRFLTIRNVGTDNIDLAAAQAHGIRIANVPAYSPNAIAEFAVTATLHLLRRLGEVEAKLAASDYQAATAFLGRELAQQTVGVVGAGRIGRAAIKLFHGFGAKVLAYDPHPVQDDSLACEYVELDELFAQADVIDLHIPGIAANDHIIGAAELAKMKPNALLINTARGNLIDTQALLHALEHQQLGGAGIDTYERESANLLTLKETGRFEDPTWDRLRAMPNVVLTPHIAYLTETAVQNMVEFSLNYLIEFLTVGATETEVHPR
ncbi:D-2-hydroxyacid dehydrogenase [Lacticaseibacillus daqingensis]|uniref:D-2-hydroxyacid dehydrogenase n=1 Tax=Lacticaseibacillus daqingensis TaxID=2486014 RepID=UPI000F78412D|nr:D-2-hydroxyacid dehydrogenase [Lacticaseibacillus daqingensis]